jgi:hypothetical protein
VPILAAYPVVDAAQVGVDALAQIPTLAEARGFAFRSLDGQSILPFTGNEFIARWGIQNLDVPARQIVEETIPNQDGTELTDIKVGSRTYMIPIFVGANSGHLQYLKNRARMRSFFNFRNNDPRTNGGTFDLVATSVLGERTLRSLYVDGMNGSWDQDTAGHYWETFGLQAIAVNPYWNGGTWSTSLIRQRAANDLWFTGFPGQLAATQVLNNATSIKVDGDVPSWAKIEATGPCSALTVKAGDLLIDLPEGLAPGEVFVMDTDPRTKRITFDGVHGLVPAVAARGDGAADPR